MEALTLVAVVAFVTWVLCWKREVESTCHCGRKFDTGKGERRVEDFEQCRFGAFHLK